MPHPKYVLETVTERPYLLPPWRVQLGVGDPGPPLQPVRVPVRVQHRVVPSEIVELERSLRPEPPSEVLQQCGLCRWGSGRLGLRGRSPKVRLVGQVAERHVDGEKGPGTSRSVLQSPSVGERGN